MYRGASLRPSNLNAGTPVLMQPVWLVMLQNIYRLMCLVQMVPENVYTVTTYHPTIAAQAVLAHRQANTQSLQLGFPK